MPASLLLLWVNRSRAELEYVDDKRMRQRAYSLEKTPRLGKVDGQRGGGGR